jgi:threonine synthase
MNYISTRGDTTPKRFCDILLEGLAPDGGLYLPAHYPQVTDATLTRWRDVYHQQGYAELAFEVLSLYIDDIPVADLKALCTKTYTAEVFGTGEIVPLRHLENGIWLEALSNGPTLAFKDMAMQLLGNLFEYELARRGEELNILGATSGDTGSAAEYAMRGKKGVRVFMTSPAGRMSPFQQAQMFSLMDENIFNIAVDGVFDDCQDMVKAVSNDLDFKRQYKIGTVNSINWARLLAQVVYYFAGYFQATQTNTEKVTFAVPSGNFGNVCAGHVASNFERFVFDLLGRDGARIKSLFGDALSRVGFFDLEAHPAFSQAASRYGFESGKSTHVDRLATIKDTWERHGMMIDTHTADGVKVAREHLQAGVPMIVLETALPIKFAETIVEATGQQPDRPARFIGIEDLPKRVISMPASVPAIKAFIVENCA